MRYLREGKFGRKSYDRKLLADLSSCAWESLKVFFQAVVPENETITGAVIAVQTFGDFLGFNPQCHIPHFVVNISLTYKAEILIAQP